MASQTPSTDLKAFLLTDSDIRVAVGGRIHLNAVKDGIFPYIWFALSDHASEGALNDAAGLDPFTYTYDLECWAQNITHAEEIESFVVNKLNFARGTFGDGTVQGVFVTGQPSDYIPKGIGSSTGLHASNLLVTVMGWAA